MLLENISISQKIIDKVLHLRTNPVPMHDSRNKLEILAVKVGLKPAYLGFRDVTNPPNDDLAILKQFAEMIGLEHMASGIPPLYFSRQPKVPDYFRDAYLVRENFDALWIYSSPEITPKIRDCISGEINEGYVLGYPKCCIEWHAEKRAIEVESAFNERMDKWEEITARHMFGTWRKYPFVSHWACSKCLNGESQETSKLNSQYRDLARQVGFNLEQNLIAGIRKFCSDLGKPWLSLSS